VRDVATVPRIETPHFGIDVEHDADTVRIVVLGELDIATSPALDATLRRLRDAGSRRLRLDLRGLTFLDGCGVVQLRRWRRLSQLEGFELRIELPVADARRVIDLTGLAGEL
jgi:anti-sigma B factor antagonist